MILDDQDRRFLLSARLWHRLRLRPRLSSRAYRLALVFVFATISTISFCEPRLSAIIDDFIVDLEFSSDGNYFFVEGFDSVVRYDLATGEPDHTLRGFFWRTAVSPDGARLAVADENLRIIDVKSGQVLNSYSIPDRTRESGWVGKIDFVGDKKLLVTRYGPRSHVADLESGRWHVIDAAHVFVTPSGRVAIQKQDDRIEVRETVAAKGPSLSGLEFRPANVILSDSGSRLLLREERSGGEAGSMDVWHVVDAQTMLPRGVPWVVASMGEFSEAAWFDDRPVALYHDVIGFGVTVVDIEQQDVLFRSSAFHLLGGLLSPDGRWLAIDVVPNDFEDPYYSVYRIADPSDPYVSIRGNFTLERFSDDGDYLFFKELDTDEIMRYDLWEKKFDRSIRDYDDSDARIQSSLSSDGMRLARIDLASWTLRVSNTSTHRELQVLSLPSTIGHVGGLSFRGSDRYVVLEEPHVTTDVLDLDTGAWQGMESGQMSMSVDGRVAIGLETNDVLVRESYRSTDMGTRLVVGGRPVGVWLAPEGDALVVVVREQIQSGNFNLVLHQYDAISLTASQDLLVVPDQYRTYHDSARIGGRLISAFSRDGNEGLGIFDVRDRRMLFSLSGVRFSHARLSPDGRWIGVATEDGFVEVYSLFQQADVAARAPPRLVSALSHGDQFEGLAISGDGSVVATVGTDGSILLWDGRTGRMFRRIAGGSTVQRGQPAGIALSPGGSEVMSTWIRGDLEVVFVSWEVSTGTPLGVYTNARLATAQDVLLFDGGNRALVCGHSQCTLEEPRAGSDSIVRQIGAGGPDRFLRQVSLAPDNLSVALMSNVEEQELRSTQIEWVRLDGNGRWTYRIPANTGVVHSVSALGDSRVVVSMSDATGPLLLFLDGRDARAQRGPLFESVFAVDNDRLAAFRDDRGELHILSSHDYSVLHRFTSEHPPTSVSPARRWLFNRLAISDDGRWVAFGSAAYDTRVWDTTTGEVRALLTSNPTPPRRVEFDSTSQLLLVSGYATSSLWDLREGRIVRQLNHHSEDIDLSGGVFATLVGDTVVYLSPRTGAAKASTLESWSARYGSRTISADAHYTGGIQGGRRMDGTYLIAAGVYSDSRSSFLSDVYATEVKLLRIDDSGLPMKIPPSDWWTMGPLTWNLHDHSGIVLVDLGSDGLAAFNSSTGERIWARDDLLGTSGTKIGRIMLNSDATSAVIRIASDHDWLGGSVFILDAATGATRLVLPEAWNIVPVVHDNVVHALLRADGANIQILSTDDGSIEYDVRGSELFPQFAIANRTGDLFLIAGAEETILFDTNSSEYDTVTLGVSTKHQVTFSPNGRFLGSVEADGTVGIWEVHAGPLRIDEVARLITFADGDWAVVASDGRYDASSSADLETLSWVMSDAPTKPLPLAIFFGEYYEPQLLVRLLSGEIFEKIESVADIDRAQPRVEIMGVTPSVDGSVNVSVEVTKSGARGVGAIKLFRDGQIVGLRRCTETSDVYMGSFCQVDFDDISLPTVAGFQTSDSAIEEAERRTKVEFSAYAFNSDGVKSETHRFIYPRTDEDLRPRRAFVIVVGINAYSNPSWNLQYAAADARAMGDIVARGLRSSGAFKNVHVVPLITEIDSATGEMVGSAARDDLLAVLNGLAGKAGDEDRVRSITGGALVPKATPDDVVFIGFSGHGLAGDDGVFHLFMSDIGDGIERVVDKEVLSKTLRSDMLEQHLRSVDAVEMVMVIDSCNAAAIVEGKGFKPGPMGSRGLGQLAYDKAMMILAGSHAEGDALEHGGAKHGLLSLVTVREGLESGKADRFPEDGFIDFSEMLSYGEERVPLLYKEIYGSDRGALVPEIELFMELRGVGSSRPAPQRPRLFDFAQGGYRASMPVVD